ncbi:GNAT family N-acetyltransferase [Tabrizicola sp.]|uniref:GNAT family N-acetyltransferase n=1 Tax=Tabrizicola sp. TaxID=2005166 RepID=UPI003F2C2412
MITRLAKPADAAGMTVLLNAVIARGGTTAHQSPMTETEVREYYIDGSDVHSSVIAEDAGTIIGWQSVGQWKGDPHIGTFVQPDLQAKGVGAALFALTLTTLRRTKISYIVAWIRADNVPGLAYYSRIGFRDIGGDPSFALDDGQVVGRIYRRFDL